MASTVIQFRVDDEIKNKAINTYKKIGVDISSALRTFLIRSIESEGFPFEMSQNNEELEIDRLMSMFEFEAQMSKTNNMTLEEINEVIDEVRKRK